MSDGKSLTPACDALMDFVIYTLGPGKVIQIIEDAQKARRYICPRCKHVLLHSEQLRICPGCHCPLRW